MIHAVGARGLEKLIISRKLKSSLGGGVRLFLLSVVLPLPPSLPPLPLPPELPFTLYSRNGRNFKRKFTNEGDFPRTPLTALLPTEKRRRTLRRGKSRGAFPQQFSALHHQRTRPRLSPSFIFLFFLFLLPQFTRAVIANCPARPRKMRYRGLDKNSSFHVPRDRNCFTRKVSRNVFPACTLVPSRF